MFANCPKCGAGVVVKEMCPACGLIEEEEKLSWQALLVYVPEETNAIAIYLRAALLAGLAWYGWHLAAMDVTNGEIGGALMHYPILIIHEAGHVVFWVLGEFMRNLGGALFQITLPLILGGVALVKRRDPFLAAVCFWWSAVAVLDTAPYVYDAYKPQLMLLTGTTGDHGAHDFIDVLGDLGLLMKAQPIGRGVHKVGIGMLVLAIAWGARVLWLQYRNRGRLD